MEATASDSFAGPKSRNDTCNDTPPTVNFFNLSTSPSNVSATLLLPAFSTLQPPTQSNLLPQTPLTSPPTPTPFT